jgi:hypothetical protein
VPQVELSAVELEKMIRNGQIGKLKSVSTLNDIGSGVPGTRAVYEVDGKEVVLTTPAGALQNSRVSFSIESLGWAEKNFKPKE